MGRIKVWQGYKDLAIYYRKQGYTDAQIFEKFQSEGKIAPEIENPFKPTLLEGVSEEKFNPIIKETLEQISLAKQVYHIDVHFRDMFIAVRQSTLGRKEKSSDEISEESLERIIGEFDEASKSTSK